MDTNNGDSKSNANKRAEQYQNWLEDNTALSVSSMKNYFYVIRRLLERSDSETPSVEDMNRFIFEYERNEIYNVLVVRSALKKFCVFIKSPELAEQLKRTRWKSNSHKKPFSNISIEDIRKLQSYFPHGKCRDIFLIQTHTGCREHEAFFIEAKNVQYQENGALIHVIKKGGGNMTYFFPGKALALKIFTNKAYEGKRYPFLDTYFQQMERMDLMAYAYPSLSQMYYRAWKKACGNAGLQRYASHDARRAVGRAIHTATGDIYLVQKALGHKDVSTTVRYLEGMNINVEEVLTKISQGRE